MVKENKTLSRRKSLMGLMALILMQACAPETASAGDCIAGFYPQGSQDPIRRCLSFTAGIANWGELACYNAVSAEAKAVGVKFELFWNDYNSKLKQNCGEWAKSSAPPKKPSQKK